MSEHKDGANLTGTDRARWLESLHVVGTQDEDGEDVFFIADLAQRYIAMLREEG